MRILLQDALYSFVALFQHLLKSWIPVKLGSRWDVEFLRRCGVWWGQGLARGWGGVVGEAEFKELDFGGGKIKDGGLALILGWQEICFKALDAQWVDDVKLFLPK